MTLEEAQAEIVRLNEELTERTNERDALTQTNTALNEDVERLRKLNQNYFNKLSAQFQKQPNEKNDGEDEVLSCEEFARTLSI